MEPRQQEPGEHGNDIQRYVEPDPIGRRLPSAVNLIFPEAAINESETHQNGDTDQYKRGKRRKNKKTLHGAQQPLCPGLLFFHVATVVLDEIACVSSGLFTLTGSHRGHAVVTEPMI